MYLSTIRPQDIKRLKKVKDPLCITAYIPIETGPGALRVNSTALNSAQNTIKAYAKELAVDSKHITPVLERIAEAGERLSPDTPAGTLAVFATVKTKRMYYVPMESELMVNIADRFELTRVDKLFRRDKHFLTLVVSQHGARLYKGSFFMFREIPLRAIRASLPSLLRLDEFERELQTHSEGMGSRSGSEGFHGHGTFKDKRKGLIAQYFRIIDRKLKHVLARENLPLVLMGVDYLLPLYRQANTYPKLLHKGVSGNFEYADSTRLHHEAWLALAKQSS